MKIFDSRETQNLIKSFPPNLLPERYFFLDSLPRRTLAYSAFLHLRDASWDVALFISGLPGEIISAVCGASPQRVGFRLSFLLSSVSRKAGVCSPPRPGIFFCSASRLFLASSGWRCLQWGILERGVSNHEDQTVPGSSRWRSRALRLSRSLRTGYWQLFRHGPRQVRIRRLRRHRHRNQSGHGRRPPGQDRRLRPLPRPSPSRLHLYRPR